MLELICQQRYRVDGIPVDTNSKYRNHGAASDTSPAPGPAPDRGAIQFANPASQVLIPLGTLGAWSPLVALKIEVDLRIEPTGALDQTLVEGNGSFLFYIDQHAPAASVMAEGAPMYVRASGQFAPDGAFHPVPTGRWVTLGFEHDGFAKMRVLIDGNLVGETIVDAGVPGVSAPGVSVGNRVAGGRPLLGDIEELRIWRLDPNEMKRQFLCRPYTAKTAKCWEDIVRKVGQWLRDHPAQAKSIANDLAALRRQLMHGIYLLPLAEQDHLRGILNRYQRLWCQGHIHGPEMAGVFTDYIGWIRRHGLDPESGSAWTELKPALERMRHDLHGINWNCDPEAQALFELIRRAQGEVH